LHKLKSKNTKFKLKKSKFEFLMNIHSHFMVMTQFIININDDRRMKIDISLLINDLHAKCCRAVVQNAGHATSLQYS